MYRMVLALVAVIGVVVTLAASGCASQTAQTRPISRPTSVPTVKPAGAATATPSANRREIAVSQLLRASVVMGRLGQPLGSKLVVEGRLNQRAVMSNPLTVTKVNDVARNNPVTLEATNIALKPGINYVLEGYESGEFAGAPGWLNPDAQQPFQYHAKFVVTRIISDK